MKRTVQQQKTIDAPLGNILVSAAAGSGKTSVMTERIVNRILSGNLDIRNVLVMTFTDAAAKSMRDKIEARLREAVNHADSPDRKQFLLRQLAYLGQSSISTIHAFCLEVVRNFYYLAEGKDGKLLLEPGFRIEDQGEVNVLLANALDDLFETYYENCDNEPDLPENKNFLLLVDSFGSPKTDEPLRSRLRSFYHFLRSMPDYNGWLDRQKTTLENTIRDFDHSPCYYALRKGLRLRLENAGGKMSDLRDFLSASPCFYKNKDKNRETLESFDRFYRYMEELIRIAGKDTVTWNELYRFFQEAPPVPAFRKGKGDSFGPKEEWMDLLKSGFAELLYYTTGRFGTKLYETEFVHAKCFTFTKTKEEITEELKEMQPVLERFYAILLDLDEAYSKAKFDSNMIDFGDFEHIALQILKNENAGSYYRGKYKEIYLDEYQDTSSIQEAILQRVSDGNCFMVGDVKQSIYKFRHAKPQIFMSKYCGFSRAEAVETGASADEPGEQDDSGGKTGVSGWVYELNKNFRSVTGILNAVNDVFFQVMSAEAGEIEYNEPQALVPHREDYPERTAPVGILLVDLAGEEDFSGEGNGEELPEDGASQEGVSQEGASQDGESQEAGERDPEDSGNGDGNPDGEPPIAREEATKYQKEAVLVALKIRELIDSGYEPDQIAVLGRTKNICSVFAEAIKKEDIPVEEEQNEPFMERYELKVIEAFLMILDNPMQDIPLAGVMHSPLFQGGFSEEEMLSIRTEYRDAEYFYQCCEKYCSKGGDEELKKKLCEFYNWIASCRDRLPYHTVSELIESVYLETGFLTYAASMPDGLLRVESLYRFQDWAGGYDRSRQSGLYSFLKYIGAMRDKAADQSPFGPEESHSNSVRVMTIHRSKGLEYKVVFLVGNNRKMTAKDTKEPILASEEFGVGFLYVNPDKQVKYPTPLVNAMREEMRKAEMAEEMRLFYVGMTRAMDRLYITGYCDGKELRDGKNLSGVITRARSYPAWQPLPPHMALSAKNTLEWILMSVARNPYLDFSPLFLSSYPGGEGQNEGNETNKGNENAEDVSPFYSKAWSLETVPYFTLEAKEAELLAAREEKDRAGREIPPIRECVSTGCDDMKEALRSKFYWQYCYSKATQIPLKISVSEIKRHEQEQNPEEMRPTLRGINVTMKEPSGSDTNSLDKRETGIAVHSFFRYMDLDTLIKNPGQEAVQSHIRQMLDKKMIREVEYHCLTGYAGKFEKFLTDPLAERIHRAGKQGSKSLFREMPFTLKLNCSKVFGPDGFSGEDCFFTQGMIDCWFIEGKDAVLVDYKTDTIRGDGEQVRQTLQERYHMQLSLYARAITEATGYPVKESLIWLVHAGKTYPIHIDQTLNGWDIS